MLKKFSQKGLKKMKRINDDLITREALYMIEHKATVRQTGSHFNRSKSAVHRDMRKVLPNIDYSLATEVSKLLKFNIAERAHRGGAATRERRQK